MSHALVLTLLLAAPPGARPPPEAGPAAQRAYFEALRDRRAQRPEPPPAPPPPVVPLADGVEARVEAWVDDRLRISRPLTARQRRMLVRRGIPVARTHAELDGDAILDGRFHRILRIAPALLEGEGELALAAAVGGWVRLRLGRSEADGHLEVVALQPIGGGTSSTRRVTGSSGRSQKP